MRPRIVASKCLGFAECRYNGQTVPDGLIEMLKPHVDFITVCPEVEIGLGVPRHPVRIVELESRERLIQPATGKDCTLAMEAFIGKFLEQLEGIDAFILKFSSPSCGIGMVKVYPPGQRVGPLRKRAGFFGKAVLDKFKDCLVDDEGRLSNYTIRETFLTGLFRLADYRENVKDRKSLHLFQERNKLLFFALDQELARKMGRLSAEGIAGEYKSMLIRIVKKEVKKKAYANSLLKGMQGMEGLGDAEQMYLESSIKKYQDGRLPLSAALALLHITAHRLKNKYVLNQSLFSPYPEGLISLRDSGKACE